MKQRLNNLVGSICIRPHGFASFRQEIDGRLEIEQSWLVRNRHTELLSPSNGDSQSLVLSIATKCFIYGITCLESPILPLLP